jgi:hypothetical protein
MRSGRYLTYIEAVGAARYDIDIFVVQLFSLAEELSSE